MTLKVMNPLEDGKPLCDLEVKGDWTISQVNHVLKRNGSGSGRHVIVHIIVMT